MQEDWRLIGLEDLGTVRVRGPDAARFLQGQVSNDVTRITPQRSLLAGYHNPQGRVTALLRLVLLEPDDLLAIVPRELATTVASRLAKFVLRSKVKITDESDSWHVSGLIAPAPDPERPVLAGVSLPTEVHTQTRVDTSIVLRAGDTPPRWVVISPTNQESPTSGFAAGDRATWRRLDIAAGQPQVYAKTSEEFVAQMLNLDVLGAIAFDKGCYTGQEVIARAHYRGRVKRRMQRFVSRGASQLIPGDSGQLADGRTFKVVEAVQLADGRCEFLAVAPLPSGEQVTREAQAQHDAQAPPLNAEQLPLPYALPD